MSADIPGMEKSGASMVQLVYQGIIPSGFVISFHYTKVHQKMQ
jgi:hypothetical protein